MKILHTVGSYFPSLGGMQEVVRQLSERLVKLGHQVTVATGYDARREGKSIQNVQIESFKITGNEAEGFKGDVESYRRFLLNSEFDIMVNFAAQQWATDIALPILSEIKAKKVFVPTGFSGLYLPAYQLYFEKMKNRMQEYDMNVFLSENYRDIHFARENKINKRIIIPNGASEDEFLQPVKTNIGSKLNIKSETSLILHVGSYSGLKGHAEACQIFLRSRISNSVLLLAGNGIQDFRSKYWYKVRLPLLFKNLYRSGKRILMTDLLSREETVAAYHAADLFLFPSNIECSPIVLFECMAARTPFLTTDVGNSKEIIQWSGAGELLPTFFDKKGKSHAKIAPSAQLLEIVLNDKERLRRYSDQGFESWKKNFTWEAIAGKYESLYRSILI